MALRLCDVQCDPIADRALKESVEFVGGPGEAVRIAYEERHAFYGALIFAVLGQWSESGGRLEWVMAR